MGVCHMTRSLVVFSVVLDPPCMSMHAMKLMLHVSNTIEYHSWECVASPHTVYIWQEIHLGFVPDDN